MSGGLRIRRARRVPSRCATHRPTTCHARAVVGARRVVATRLMLRTVPRLDINVEYLASLASRHQLKVPLDSAAT